MLQITKYRITGASPLLQHSGQLADPLNAFARALKEVTGKRNNTEADPEEAAKLEWFGGLYTENGRVVIPGACMTATLINAAKKRKKGVQAKAGLICEANFVVEHDGPEDFDLLWADERFRDRTLMRVKQSGVMRTRPKFMPWATVIEVKFNDQMLNPKEVDAFVEIGGEQIGVCEGRPRFGRFFTQKL
jgi:hypothetical protein